MFDRCQGSKTDAGYSCTARTSTDVRRDDIDNDNFEWSICAFVATFFPESVIKAYVVSLESPLTCPTDASLSLCDRALGKFSCILFNAIYRFSKTFSIPNSNLGAFIYVLRRFFSALIYFMYAYN